jgi:hypothetical protein
VASHFESTMLPSDIVRRVSVEISNDFHTAGKTDKLERVLKELGFSSEGMKLGLTLEWEGPLDKQTFLQQLLRLPTTPGGSLYVVAKIDRTEGQR